MSTIPNFVSADLKSKNSNNLWKLVLKIFCKEMATFTCALVWSAASAVAWYLFLKFWLYNTIYQKTEEAVPFAVIPVAITFVCTYVWVAFAIEFFLRIKEKKKNQPSGN